MKTFSLVAAILALGLTLTTGDADAASKRLGAGKSSGMQRETISADRTATPAAPAMAPSATKAPTAAAAPTPPKRSWLGPLAGLAAGLGLAALASHLGFGEELATMLMIGLVLLLVLAVVGFILRRRASAGQPAMATAGGLQYSPSQHEPMTLAGNGVVPTSSAATDADAPTGSAGTIPADFDVAAFVRSAKVSFVRLQAANDAGNLDDLREFTTPEMFAELRLNIADRGSTSQQTEVVTIDAQVLEVSEEDSRYVVSVRFTGLIREEKDASAEAVDEVWHLTKPRDGRGGWVLAGIQQWQ